MKEWWISMYLVDGTLCGDSVEGNDIDEVEETLKKKYGSRYGGIADYGCYDDLK